MVLLACASAMVWSCGEKETHINVNPSQLWGTWIQGANYQWRFDSNGTGNCVNLGEFDPEDENNGDFSWTIDVDELEVEYKGSGELGGIDIVKLYTVKEISETAMKWEDPYGRIRTFTKLQ